VGWKQEIEGVLDFYIDSVEHPASEPDPEPPVSNQPDPNIILDLIRKTRTENALRDLKFDHTATP
jgi:hypothetical protein